jgi:ketosteroid isomerase-like protein
MSQENVEIVRALNDAIRRGDLDGFLALVHPEIEFQSLVAEAEGLTLRGHEGVREWWDSVIRSLAIRPAAEEKIEAFGDRGIMRYTIAATVEGVEVPQEQWMAWRVRDGRLIWWATFRTEAEALEAAGLSEQDVQADS